ncbi:MAG: hypothetical protein ACH346_00340, partial [Chthoniobacterales bacterium]
QYFLAPFLTYLSLLNPLHFFFYLVILLNVNTLFSESISDELQHSKIKEYQNSESFYQGSLNKEEVTASDYCEFLNVAAATDEFHLYDEKMLADPEKACIARVGTPGRWHYEVIAGRENSPIQYINRLQPIGYRKKPAKLAG